MLNRRQLISSTGAAAAVAGAGLAPGSLLAAQSGSAPGKPLGAAMKLGADLEQVDDAHLKAVVRWGIRNVYARASIADPSRMYPTVDELQQMRDIAERNGVSIDILRPRNLQMLNIDVEPYPAIMLGDGAQRDRDIEGFQNLIRACATAGIPGIRYTLSIVGNQRTGDVPGRGDATYKQSKMSAFSRDKPLTRAGRVPPELYWERITYFLERVVPVATEYRIRLASHMEDAMVPPEGYQGLSPVTNTIDGAKKFCSIHDSPYHGLLFCIGTFAEMLQNPTRDIYDVVRWFGERKKIHLVDFRNIRGNRQEFVETFPDEGDIDMLRVMKVLKDVGYDGMVVPDHQPVNPGGPEQANAFQYGYIRGLIQAVGQVT